MDMPKLYTIDDIAKLYRVSRRHARDVLVKQPGFPKPVPGSSSKIPLWLEARLEDYLSGKGSEIPQE